MSRLIVKDGVIIREDTGESAFKPRAAPAGDSAELVERLRLAANPLCWEAGDRIESLERDRQYWTDAAAEASQALSTATAQVESLAASLRQVEAERDALRMWREGYPPHPYDKEWFIAVTTFGDRVVLRALPEEYTYDFKTADDTYIKRDKIVKWMQFPDSQFVPFDSARKART